MIDITTTYDENQILKETRSLRNFIFSKPTTTTPNVFIIGAQKAGTTSLLSQLVSHPDVIKPKRKEIYYFNNLNYFKKGTSWYLKQFNTARSTETLQIDATANYFESLEAPLRIKNKYPEAKIIILLRNPVERAFSHYKMAVKYGFEKCTFSEALLLEEERLAYSKKNYVSSYGHDYGLQRLGYKTKGVYHQYLSQWMEHIPKEQFLIIQSESYFANSKIILKQVLDFLELDPIMPINFTAKNKGTTDKMPVSVKNELKEFYIPHNAQLFNLLQEKYDW